MTLTDVAAQGVLNQCIRGVAFAPGTAHLGLADSGGAEVSGGGYARQPLSFNAATLANPSVCTEPNEIDFGTVGAGWTPTTVDQGIVYSALNAGTELFSQTDTQITYAVGNRAFVTAGSLVCRFGSNGVWTAAYAQDVMEWLLRGGPTPARARYLGLRNSGTELSGGNYARLDTDGLFSAPNLANPSETTTGVQQFQSSATFTGLVNEYALYAANTGGAALIVVSVNADTIATGNEVTVDATITLT